MTKYYIGLIYFVLNLHYKYYNLETYREQWEYQCNIVKEENTSLKEEIVSIVQKIESIFNNIGGIYATPLYIAQQLKQNVIKIEEILEASSTFRESYIKKWDGKNVYYLNTKLNRLKDIWNSYNYLNYLKY